MTLRQKQSLFVRLLTRLLVYVDQQHRAGRGWEFVFADFFRPDGKGHRNDSLHYIKLAADMPLFIKGVIQKTMCPEWREIGEYWKRLHPLCRWGGDFPGDENHFSLEHEGRK